MNFPYVMIGSGLMMLSYYIRGKLEAGQVYITVAIVLSFTAIELLFRWRKK